MACLAPLTVSEAVTVRSPRGTGLAGMVSSETVMMARPIRACRGRMIALEELCDYAARHKRRLPHLPKEGRYGATTVLGDGVEQIAVDANAELRKIFQRILLELRGIAVGLERG